MMHGASKPYRTLLIAGAGRSGSTLLELMLDQIPGVVAVGELTDLWDSGLLRNERCGCGEPFRRCPFWTAVGAEAFGDWDSVDPMELLALHDLVARNRQFLRLVAAPLAPAFRSRLIAYADVVSRVLDAAASVSGADVVVDASKWPSHAMVLRRAPELDLRMAHLVRDPRGVAHSWARTVERPHALVDGQADDMREMRRDRPITSAAHWTAINLGIELVASLGVPRLFIRYEDMVTDPRSTLEAALGLAGVTAGAGALDFVSDTEVTLVPGHGIAGNPSRFRRGRVCLRAGEEWRQELTPADRAVVHGLTGPLELLYRRRAARNARGRT